MTRFDVVVAGGGLVGASVACALRASGARIAVVEAAPPEAVQPPSFDDRHTALAPTSRRFLEALELWSTLQAEAAAIREIHVSDRGRFGFTRMRAADEGLEALGWVVPNRALGAALMPVLEAGEPVRLYRPAQVTAVWPEDAGMALELAGAGGDRQRIATSLLVIAEGAHSATRDALGIGFREHDYGQSAVIANVKPERDPAGRAFERFTEHGPLALLPAGQGRAALIWTVPEAAADALLALDDVLFLERLQQTFGYRLGRLREVGRRQAYPLAAITAERFVAARTVVLGNAAHTLHPVAGQGFNLALRDVALLAELVDRAVRAGHDPGAAALLGEYERQRRADYRRTFTFTDSLVRVFSNRLPLVTPARNAALVALDLFPGMRRSLMRQAMGRGGRLPRLTRGLPLDGSD
jgi:2-octaprenyl-6-methoxyphenol hydroxylase